jgi:hypothetical protein
MIHLGRLCRSHLNHSCFVQCRHHPRARAFYEERVLESARVLRELIVQALVEFCFSL